jgi:hypothetical protein
MSMTAPAKPQRTTRIYRQLLQIIAAAGLRDVFPRARLFTLTVKHPSHETLEIRVQGGHAPSQRIIEVQFTSAPGEQQPLATQEVLRMDTTGHGLEVWMPGSIVAGTRQGEIKKCMQAYSDKLEQEGYTQAAIRGYSLWVQFYTIEE